MTHWRKSAYVFFLLASVVLFQNCSTTESDTDPAAAASCFGELASNTEWSNQTEVVVTGYASNASEPRQSHDEVVLFWNDKPADDSNMELHYAIQQPGGSYQYIGTLPGANATGVLDGVPSVDAFGNFYFVSLRTYGSNSQSLFSGQVQVLGPSSMQINGVAAADNVVSAKTAGTVDMDSDISWDGLTLVVSRAQFTGGKTFPDSSVLKFFNVSGRTASVNTNSDALLANVNRSNCRVYAGNLSADGKELYMNLVPLGEADLSQFRIAVAKRASTTEPFGVPQVISAITGTVTEGASISSDGKTLLFHKLEGGRLRLFKVSRP